MRRIDLLDRTRPTVIPAADGDPGHGPTRGRLAAAAVAVVVGSVGTACSVEYGLQPTYNVDAGHDAGAVWAGIPPIDAHVPDAEPADAASHDAGVVDDTGPHDG